MTAAVRSLAAARGEKDATVTDIRAAGELLLPLARRCGADLERFLAEIAVGAETDALDPRAEAVTLLTLHGAKGLEYDVVFLAGCERGLLPLRLPGSRAAVRRGRRRGTAAALRRHDPGPRAAAAQLRRPPGQERRRRERHSGDNRPVTVPGRAHPGAAQPDRGPAAPPPRGPPAPPVWALL